LEKGFIKLGVRILSDQELLEAYQTAIHLQLDSDFIKVLSDELIKRYLLNEL